MVNSVDIQQQLNQFAEKQWDKTLAFLQNRFSLNRPDCEDIFQESFLTLYRKITNNELVEMTASLSTYFNAICRNKALELTRKRGKVLTVLDEYPDNMSDSFDENCVNKLLELDDNNEQTDYWKEALVCEVVENLPEPCNKILWGFYRDGFSMKTMADLLDYKNENTIKVTKHRCCDKFRKRFSQISQLSSIN